MDIEFVNHASLVVTSGRQRIISDPWLEGRVFNEGWALLSPSAMSFDAFRDITHIWFSHEHPDHFFPDNLKKIPSEHRRAIHVLFQVTRDKKIVTSCERLGFGQVSELVPDTWVPLDTDVELLNCPLGTQWDADSWLCIRTPQGTLLNLNDCGVGAEEALAIKKQVDRVDVLATQFSYAAWQRNPAASDFRRDEARDVMRRVQEQIRVLRPRYVIPFASFSWFCAEENFYLNAEMNQIRDVAEIIRHQTDADPIVMYPGDRWTLGQTHDPESAVARYERDAVEISDPSVRPRTRRAGVDANVLVKQGRAFQHRLNNLAHPLVVRCYLAAGCYKNRARFGISPFRNLLQLLCGYVEPAHIYVTDLNQAFTFDLVRGLSPDRVPRADCDIMLSSASLSYCFRFDWGGETLQMNGCFSENDAGRRVEDWGYPDRFLKYCRLLRHIDLGHDLNWLSPIRSALRRLAPSPQPPVVRSNPL